MLKTHAEQAPGMCGGLVSLEPRVHGASQGLRRRASWQERSQHSSINGEMSEGELFYLREVMGWALHVSNSPEKFLIKMRAKTVGNGIAGRRGEF